MSNFFFFVDQNKIVFCLISHLIEARSIALNKYFQISHWTFNSELNKFERTFYDENVKRQ